MKIVKDLHLLNNQTNSICSKRCEDEVCDADENEYVQK